MQTNAYTLSAHVDAPPDVAEQRVRDALADQGFGILSEIDVQATLQAKLSEDVGVYRILGACNPSLAHTAIGLDPDVGALLPCNVVLRACAEGGTDVVAIDPARMLDVAAAELAEVAAEARQRLTAALASLG